MASETPASDSPATDAPATDAPATDAPATDAPATDAPVKITVTEDGPLKVEGDIDLVAHDGTSIEVRPGRPAWLCRCGGSKNKPFCDGAHSKIGFAGAEAAVAALEPSGKDGADG